MPCSYIISSVLIQLQKIPFLHGTVGAQFTTFQVTTSQFSCGLLLLPVMIFLACRATWLTKVQDLTSLEKNCNCVYEQTTYT